MRKKKPKLSPEAMLAVRILDPKTGDKKAIVMEKEIESAVATDGRIVFIAPGLYEKELAGRSVKYDYLFPDIAAQDVASFLPPGIATKWIERSTFLETKYSFFIPEWMGRVKGGGQVYFQKYQEAESFIELVCTSHEAGGSLFSLNLSYLAMLSGLVKGEHTISIQLSEVDPHNSALKINLGGLEGDVYLMPMLMQKRKKLDEHGQRQKTGPAWAGD